MGLGAEGFTVLAILEARDMASEIYESVQAKVEGFTGSMKSAADVASESGAKIDDSFLKTASGADALTLSTSRVEAAQAKLAASNKAQADAERSLLEARAQVTAAADGDTAAMDRQVAANDKLTAAQKKSADATKALKDAQAAQTKIMDAQADSGEAAAVKTEASGGKLSSVAGAMGKLGLGVAVAGGLMVKGAADFQSSTTHLVTDAGESSSQLGRVQAGLLGISTATGTSSKDIVAGMYHIESSIPPMADASKRAGIALNEMTVAAQGAKVGGADLGTVSQALAGTLNSYSSQGYTATQMMNGLIATTGAGDMKMQDLASSLGNVSGIAASAGLKFSEVGGAIATMTAQNMTADRATQDLANTIGSLQKPQGPAIAEMQQLGLNANTVSQNLGKTGLTGTLGVLTQAIAAHTKGGQVLIDSLKSSQAAGADATTMFKLLPKSIDGAASSLLNGSTTAAEFNKSIAGLDAPQQHLAKQFETLVKNSGSFNTLLKSSSPAAQTYNAAMGTMLGGSTGLNTALALSGGHMAAFQANVNTVGTALADKSKDVTNWSTIQGTLSQKMDVAKAAIENTGTAIGVALLPAVTSIVQSVLKVIQPIAQWVEGHQKLTAVILGSLAGIGLLVGAINLGVKAFGAIKTAVSAVGSVFQGVGKLFSLFSGSADTVAASADGAAGSMDGLAASTDADTVSTDANTVAADASSSGWIMAGLSAAGAAVKFVAVKVAQMAVTVATQAWTTAQWLFNAAMDANPITLVVIAIAGLAAGVVYCYNHFTAFRDIVKGVFEWLKGAVSDVISWVDGHWRLIVSIIGGPIGLVVALVTKYWSDIKQWFTDGVNAVEGIVSWFGSLPGKFETWLDNTAAAVGRGIDTAIAFFTGLPKRALAAIESFFSTGLVGDFARWFNSVNSTIDTKIADFVKFFIDLPGKILNAVEGFAKLLVNAGVQLVEGLINGVESMASKAADAVGNLGKKLVSSIGNVLGISSPSKVMADQIGSQIPAGIAQGILANVGVLQNAMKGTANVSLTAGQAAFSGSALAPVIPATSAVGGQGGTVVNINMANAMQGAQLLSSQGMDDFVNRMGTAIATKILPSGGLRIAM
jgi:phage-related protein